MATRVIKEIDFETIHLAWKKELWSDREDIRPVSSMTYNRKYDMTVYDLSISNPIYLGYYVNDVLVGVNSGHIVGNREYRSRGLWVDEKFRGQNIGKQLLISVIDQGKIQNSLYTWSLPRKQSLYAYLSAGFEKTSKWINEGVLYGPNCYVRKNYE